MSNNDGQKVRGEGPGYFRESRSLGLSIVSILPLMVLYHCGIVQSGHAVRNIAEVWLTGPLGLVGLEAAHVLNVALVVGLIALLWRNDRAGSFSFLTVPAMMAEAALYAALLYKGAPALAGMVDERASQVLFAISMRLSAPLLLALGAGAYEELFFRLLLLGGGAFVLRKVFMWDRKWSLAVMLVISSLLFAGAHHIGPLGEEFRSYDFLFRAICGLLLGAVFLSRGLGVAAWTHAIYNAMVMLQLIGEWR